mgnify:CR=1 FL=1
MADIGCGNGVISKEFAKLFGFKRCDMFDPYGTELKYDAGNIIFNYHKTIFKPKIKYNLIMMSSSLHHIHTPIETIKTIK